MTQARRKPRADAVRNRTRLIEAAKEILGHGGPEASLEAVARRAGVGIGTLYRHFPTREALFQAVYRHEVEQLVALARDLAEGPDPAGAVRDWVHALIALVATKRGLLGALAVVPTEDSRAIYDALGADLRAALDALLARAVAAEALRDDVGAEDVLATAYGLCYARPPEPGWQARVTRLVDIFLDGLAPR